MSALGQKRTCRGHDAVSAITPKADIGTAARNVRFELQAGIARANYTTRGDDIN
jgi:hypothetical protein